jgi:5-methylcytosine-specific restriction endonuclease McrA
MTKVGTKEWKEKIRNALRKKWQDLEYRKKVIEKLKGKISGMKGKRHTEETKLKISKALRGKPKSLEQIRKMSEITKKLWQNPEFREKVRKKISEKRKRWKPTEEFKRKRSEFMKKNNPMKRLEIREKFKEDKNPAKRLEVRKKISESKKGAKNPNWQGGKMFEEYPEQFFRMRKAIRERDNYTCQLCGKYPAFDVHHIDYNKENCEPENLITLCKKCHLKTNKNREYWKNYLKNKIKQI